MEFAQEMSLEERLERIERRIEELRGDWRRDLGIVFESLRVIGQALDVQHKLTHLIDKLEKTVDDE